MPGYLEKNGWRRTDMGRYVDSTGKCRFICHKKVAWRVQRMRDHKKMKRCFISKWLKKIAHFFNSNRQ